MFYDHTVGTQYQYDNLLKIKLKVTKNPSCALLALYERNPRVAEGFPQKGLVTRRVFILHEVIIFDDSIFESTWPKWSNVEST